MSFAFANPRKVPGVFLSPASMDLDAVRSELRQLQERIFAWVQEWRPSDEIDSWQVRACVWVLDDRPESDDEPPSLAVPDSLRIHFEPTPDRADDRGERSRAERERQRRDRVGRGMIGRVYCTGEPLSADLAREDTPHSRAYGLDEADAGDLQAGLRWAIAVPLVAVLPLEADDREGVEFHVVGVLNVDGIGFALEDWEFDDLTERMIGASSELAERLADLPGRMISIDMTAIDMPDRVPRASRSDALSARVIMSAISREMARIRLTEVAIDPAGPQGVAYEEIRNVHDSARKIVELVDPAGEAGREVLVEMIERWAAHESWAVDDRRNVAWCDAMVLASEAVEFREARSRKRLRECLSQLVSLALDRMTDFPVRPPAEEALIAALRKLTGLTGSGDLPDTMSLLGRCLDVDLAPMPRVRQAAAQCVQSLLWNAPPPEGSGEGGRSVRALSDGLAGLANQVLEGEGELAPVERATLAMNLVQSLGLLGDRRFAELAVRLMREAPYIGRLLIPRLEKTLARWGPSRASLQLREAIASLLPFKQGG